MLKPTDLKSEGGATLTLQEDGSILVSGENPGEDTYTLVTGSGLSQITAFRLEAIPDSSLPQNGPGRYGNGNFHLNEFQVFSGDNPVILNDVLVPTADGDIRRIIDGKIDSGGSWIAALPIGRKISAVFATDPIGVANDVLRFELTFSMYPHSQHGLGRFRISVTNLNASSVFEAVGLRQDLQERELADFDIAIGKALARMNKPDEAAAAFARALDRVEKDDQRKKLFEQIKEHQAALTLMAEQRPEDLPLQLALPKVSPRAAKKHSTKRCCSNWAQPRRSTPSS